MHMNRIKAGNGRARIPPSAAFSTILWVTGSVYEKHDVECVITSGVEGVHGRSSEHFKGDAVDFRTRHLTPEQEANISSEVRDRLGDDFDVVLESDHLHVEYDPKLPL